MRCPTLSELPPPIPGKTGWPWTEESPPLSEHTPNGSPWPRISIITPSYNQGEFIEETIRSVLLQGYPDLEYIIMDGGSTDGSVDIIEKHADYLTYWTSEPDRGQAHAINKGLARASGEILAWLNSDDIYYPGTLEAVIDAFRRVPEAGLVFGSAMFVDEEGTPMYVYRGIDRPLLRKMKYWRGWDIPQPTLFFRKRVFNEFGGPDESYRYALDYEWFLRVSRNTPAYCSDAVLATYRLHGGSKTGNWQASKHLFHDECAKAVRKHVPPRSRLYWQWQTARVSHEVAMLLAKAKRRATIVARGRA